MHKDNRSAYADNAHGGCRKRTILRAAHKAARSVCIIIKAIGQGIVQAVKVWFEPRAERTV
jgi:hypothetical protein